jgi:hypothetical protein
MPLTLKPTDLLALLTLAFCVLGPVTAEACDGAGIVKRIEGDPHLATFARAGAPNRLRVLQVVCIGDVIDAHGGAVTLSISGKGDLVVQPQTSMTVDAGGRPSSYVANAYAALISRTAPDMARMRVEVREKGGEDPFGFAVQNLDEDPSQTVSVKRRAILVRLVGGKGPYSGELTTAGGAKIDAASDDKALIFKGVELAPGKVEIAAQDGYGHTIHGSFEAVTEEPALVEDYQTVDDAEIRAAAEAIDLARGQPKVKSLEAEQILDDAPVLGLDRLAIYDLIESY